MLKSKDTFEADPEVKAYDVMKWIHIIQKRPQQQTLNRYSSDSAHSTRPLGG
jgi:hypothetical protein